MLIAKLMFAVMIVENIKTLEILFNAGNKLNVCHIYRFTECVLCVYACTWVQMKGRLGVYVYARVMFQ